MPFDWKAYYEKEAEITDLDPTNDPSEIQRCLAAWTVFPREKVSSVLDVGCGDGYFCHWLSKRSKANRIEGVDISESRLARAKSRYPTINYVHGELPDLPYEDNEFEVVTCIEVLEHIGDPVVALCELARVSSRYIVFTVPDREIERFILCPHCLKTFPSDGHLHSFDGKRIAQMAKEAGLKLLQVRSYYPPMGASKGIFPPWLGRILRSIELFFFPRPGSYLASAMMKEQKS